MMRLSGLTIAAFALEAPVLGDYDLARYAMTQGGLLVVVLVLLWMQRKDAKAQIERQDERIRILTDLVATNTQAMTRAAAASEANEKAAHRLSRALEDLEERRRR